MKVSFSTFVGIGQHTSISFKLKVSGRIVAYVSRNFASRPVRPSDGVVSWDDLEAFLNDVSLAIHKAGYQKLSAWFDREIDDFEYTEYSATFRDSAFSFLMSLNFVERDEDPVY